jgi:hypothetical protein
MRAAQDAPLIVVPRQGPCHLASGRFARSADGRMVIGLPRTLIADRSVLDAHARLLAGDAASAPRGGSP